MPGTRGGVTLKELQAKAKAAKIKGWSKMSKAELLRRLGGLGVADNEDKPKNSPEKKRPVTTAKRYEATKVAGAIADKLAKKMGAADPAVRDAMQHRLLTSVKKAVTQARKTPGATNRDVRKAAAQAVKVEVMAIRGNAAPRKKEAEYRKAKATVAKTKRQESITGGKKNTTPTASIQKEEKSARTNNQKNKNESKQKSAKDSNQAENTLTAILDAKTINKSLATWLNLLGQMHDAADLYYYQDKIASAENAVRSLETKLGSEGEIALHRKTIKELGVEIKELSLRNKDNPYVNVNINRLNASRDVLEMLIAEGGEDTIGVVDKQGNLQAALKYVTRKDVLYVDTLASSPWNIAPNDPRKTKGAGTQAIAEAIKLSKNKGFGGKLSLIPLPDAKPFYEKLGFHPGVGDEWEISAKDADDLLKKLGQR